MLSTGFWDLNTELREALILWVQSLGREDPLEEEIATHSSILAWKIPWTEGPGGLQPGCRVRHDLATEPLPPLLYMCSAWLFVTQWTVTHQAPWSMVLFLARILKWMAISSSRGSSQPRDWTLIYLHCRWTLFLWATRRLCGNFLGDLG